MRRVFDSRRGDGETMTALLITTACILILYAFAARAVWRAWRAPKTPRLPAGEPTRVRESLASTMRSGL